MSVSRALPVWRSLLYVPINVPRFVDRAHTRGADAILLDLEDSVPAPEKERARTLVSGAASRVRQAGADVVVRINRPISAAVRDLECSIGPHVDAIAVSKVEGASHVKLLDELVSELEVQHGLPIGHTLLITMIESASAFTRIDEIAHASKRIVAMNIGGEDFALDCNMRPNAEVLLHPKQHMIIAARAVGIMPLGFIDSVAEFSDRERFRAMVRRSRDFGFDGAACIHPDQVQTVNEEYTPKPEELAYAERVVRENREASAVGRGSFSIDGKMIDAPVVVRAERLLARFHAIEAREAKARAASATPDNGLDKA